MASPADDLRANATRVLALLDAAQAVMREFHGILVLDPERTYPGGDTVHVEATHEQIAAMSRAIRRGHNQDLDDLSRLRREIEQRERRHA